MRDDMLLYHFQLPLSILSLRAHEQTLSRAEYSLQNARHTIFDFCLREMFESAAAFQRPRHGRMSAARVAAVAPGGARRGSLGQHSANADSLLAIMLHDVTMREIAGLC